MIEVDESNVYGLNELVNDFAILIHLKRSRFGNHEHAIYAEAYERVYEHGKQLVEKEVTYRQYVKLKQMLLDFETQHPEVKNESKD